MNSSSFPYLSRCRASLLAVFLSSLLPACGGGSSSPVDVASTGTSEPGAVSAPPRVYPAASVFQAKPLESFLALPPWRVAVPYAPTGTMITRISDAEGFGVSDRVIKHDYARRAAWNADGTRVLLVNPWPARVLDATSWAPIGEPHRTPTDALWSNLDPDRMFGLSADQLVSYSVSMRSSTVLRAFPGYDALSIGGGEGVQSDDDRYLVLIGRNAGGIDVISYDTLDDRVAIVSFEGASGPNGDIDWAGVSPSGRFVVVKIDTAIAGFARGFHVFDRLSMQPLWLVLPDSTSHSDIGFDAEGHEVLVAAGAASSALVSIRLETGVERTELSAAAISFNVHVSCRNRLRPGWCYVSTYADTAAARVTNGPAYLSRSIIGLRLDGSGTVERYSPAFFADDAVDLVYDRQAWAVPNPWGDQVLFASDWGDPSGTARIESYVAQAAR